MEKSKIIQLDTDVMVSLHDSLTREIDEKEDQLHNLRMQLMVCTTELQERKKKPLETTASDISDNVVGRIIADENSDCATCSFYPCPYQTKYGHKYMAKGKCGDHSARISF